MFKKLVHGSLFVYFLFITPQLFAEQGSPEAGLSNTRTSANASKSQNDKWFFYLGAGIVPQPKFDTGIQANIDNVKQSNGWAGEYGGILELPGIYYRFGQTTLVGLIGNFIFENYADDRLKHLSLGYDTYNISLSAMTSTGDQPGLGYFARFDFGPTEMVQVSESPTAYDRHYFPGLFEQLALGYGLQSSSNTRLLFHVNTFYEDVVDHYQLGISFNIGLLL